MYFWELYFLDEGVKLKWYKLVKLGLNLSFFFVIKGFYLCRLIECLIFYVFEVVGCYIICYWLFYIIVLEVKYVFKFILNCIVWYLIRVCYCLDMVGIGRFFNG